MSNNNNKEIEIQARVENVAPLLELLNKNGVYINESFQNDEYYTPFHRDFVSVRPVREWFRLRDSGGRYSVNFKKWHINKEGIGTHADEYESSVADIEALRHILRVLNFKHLITVTKKRTVWNYEDYEISIDKVEGLGDFVEVEFKGSESVSDVEMVRNKMIKFLKDTGCGKIELNNGGYPKLLLFPGEADFREV